VFNVQLVINKKPDPQKGENERESFLNGINIVVFVQVLDSSSLSGGN